LVARKFAIFSIPLMIITYLGNHYRLKNLLLMTGSVMLVLIAVQTSAAGVTFREYKSIMNHYSQNCNLELGDIDHKYIE